MIYIIHICSLFFFLSFVRVFFLVVSRKTNGLSGFLMLILTCVLNLAWFYIFIGAFNFSSEDITLYLLFGIQVVILLILVIPVFYNLLVINFQKVYKSCYVWFFLGIFLIANGVVNGLSLENYLLYFETVLILSLFFYLWYCRITGLPWHKVLCQNDKNAISLHTLVEIMEKLKEKDPSYSDTFLALSFSFCSFFLDSFLFYIFLTYCIVLSPVIFCLALVVLWYLIFLGFLASSFEWVKGFQERIGISLENLRYTKHIQVKGLRMAFVFLVIAFLACANQDYLATEPRHIRIPFSCVLINTSTLLLNLYYIVSNLYIHVPVLYISITMPKLIAFSILGRFIWTTFKYSGYDNLVLLNGCHLFLYLFLNLTLNTVDLSISLEIPIYFVKFWQASYFFIWLALLAVSIGRKLKTFKFLVGYFTFLKSNTVLKKIKVLKPVWAYIEANTQPENSEDHLGFSLMRSLEVCHTSWANLKKIKCKDTRYIIACVYLYSFIGGLLDYLGVVLAFAGAYFSYNKGSLDLIILANCFLSLASVLSIVFSLHCLSMQKEWSNSFLKATDPRVFKYTGWNIYSLAINKVGRWGVRIGLASTVGFGLLLTPEDYKEYVESLNDLPWFSVLKDNLRSNASLGNIEGCLGFVRTRYQAGPLVLEINHTYVNTTQIDIWDALRFLTNKSGEDQEYKSVFGGKLQSVGFDRLKIVLPRRFQVWSYNLKNFGGRDLPTPTPKVHITELPEEPRSYFSIFQIWKGKPAKDLAALGMAEEVENRKVARYVNTLTDELVNETAKGEVELNHMIDIDD